MLNPELPTKKPSLDHSFLDKAMGLAIPPLHNTKETQELSNQLGLPISACAFAEIRSTRRATRALNGLYKLLTLASIYCLSSPDPSLNSVGYGITAINPTIWVITGEAGTTNDSNSQTHLLTLASRISQLDLGHIGQETNIALVQASSVTGEERMIGETPAEQIIDIITQWTVLTAFSPDKLMTSLVGATSTSLALAQNVFVKKFFRPAAAYFLKQQAAYIKDPYNPLVQTEYAKAIREKARKTRPINWISNALEMAIIAGAKLGSVLPNSTFIPAMMARGTSIASNIASRTQSISNSSQINNNLSEKIHLALQELRSHIHTQDQLNRHVKESPYTLPKDLKQRFSDSGIHQGIVFDLLYKTTKQHIQGLINTSQPLTIIYGDNGGGKTTLRKAISHTTDNHTGPVLKVRNGEIIDLHSLTPDHLHRLFPNLNEHTHPIPGRNFLERSGLSHSQATALFHDISELRWILSSSEDYLTQEIETSKLSNGERKILRIISFIEHHKNSAEIIFIDEAFAELHHSNKCGLNKYLKKVHAENGCHFAIIQQNTPDASIDLRQTIRLQRRQDFTGLLPNSNSNLETKVILGTTSFDVNQNPLLKSQIWRKDPLGFFELLINHDPDALQLFIESSHLNSALDPDNFLILTYNSIQEGWFSWLDKQLNTLNIPIPKNSFSTIAIKQDHHLINQLRQALETLARIYDLALPNMGVNKQIQISNYLSIDLNKVAQFEKLLPLRTAQVTIQLEHGQTDLNKYLNETLNRIFSPFYFEFENEEILQPYNSST